MSAISLKSITGITSITTPSGVDNQLTLHTNDTTQRVKVTQSGIEVVGVATFQDIDVDSHTNLDNVSAVGFTTIGQGNFAYTPHTSSWATNSAINLVGNYGGAISFNDNGNGGFVQYLDGNGQNFYIKNGAVGGTTKSSIKCVKDGNVELYYNGSKKLETTNTGAVVTGILTATTSFVTTGNIVANGTMTVGSYGLFGSLVAADPGSNYYGPTNRFGGGLALQGELRIDGDIVHIGDTNTKIRFPSADTFTVETAGIERLRIGSDGTLSKYLNSSTVQAAFGGSGQINGITALPSMAGSPLVVGRDTGTTRSAHFGGHLQFDSGYGIQGTEFSVYGNTSGLYLNSLVSGDAIIFQTHNGSSVGERLRITSAGKVGINETNPSTILHVENDNANASTYYLNTDAAILVQNKNSNATAKTVLKLEGPVGGGDCAIVYGDSSANLIFSDRENERLRIASDGKVLIGSSNHNSVIGSGVGSQLQVEGNSYATSSLALINNQSSSDPAFLVFGKSRHGSSGGATVVQNGDRLGGIRWCGADGNDLHSRAAQVDVYIDGAPGSDDMPGRMVIETTPDGSPTPTNHLILYGTNKEVRNAGHYVAQTSGSGTSSQQASFGATQSGMSASSYNYILSGSNDGGNKCVMFVNGSTRSADGGANTLTFRNDGGNLRLGNSGTSTNILGNLTIEQPIVNQQTKFQYSNSGGVGAYLSLFNLGTATGSTTGIVFGIGTSGAVLDGTDYGEGQIKVYNDSGNYGNMEFNLHVNANRSFMKIVGNGQAYDGASAGSEGMRGGVAFGNAGIAIDRSWMGQPGIHVFNANVENDTDQANFRFHGWNRSYDSYPNSSGSDFSVALVADGMTLTSDRRRKTGITTITGALNTVSQMRGVSFTYINRDLEPQTHMSMDNGKKLGFIAQEVIPLLPELILDSGEKAVELENGYCDRYNMDYGGVAPLLVEAIKELKAKNEALEARIAALESS